MISLIPFVRRDSALISFVLILLLSRFIALPAVNIGITGKNGVISP